MKIRPFSYLLKETLIHAILKLNLRPTIHVIGDSHTGVFRNHYPFRIHHVGPATAYNLHNPYNSSNSYAKFIAALSRVKPDDKIILSFGEIDCRMHIYKAWMKGGMDVPLSRYVEKTIDNYSNMFHHLEGMDITLLAIVPMGIGNNIVSTSQVTRQMIADLYNEELEKKAKDYGFNFLSIKNDVADWYGFVLPEYSEDGIHLTRNTFKFYKKALNTLNVL